jgi:hypothetical protein
MLNRKIWKKRRNGEDSPQSPSLKKFPAGKRRPVGEWRQILVVACIFLLGACAASLSPPGNRTDQEVLKKTLSDTDIMQEGLLYLGDAGLSNDYVKAKATFESLLKAYPESKWRRPSETLILLIDTMQSYGEQDALLSSTRQENDNFKKEVRYLNDRLKTETSRLSEENEQLKKDIQLLKNLEIQLEKRDKQFR